MKGRMTEYWKSSQTNYWCEVCKCWVRDSVQGRALHESGPKHRDLLERKLREEELARNASKERKEATLAPPIPLAQELRTPSKIGTD